MFTALIGGADVDCHVCATRAKRSLDRVRFDARGWHRRGGTSSELRAWMLHPIRDSLIALALVAATACADGTDGIETEPSADEVASDVQPRRPPVIYHDDGSVET